MWSAMVKEVVVAVGVCPFAGGLFFLGAFSELFGKTASLNFQRPRYKAPSSTELSSTMS